MFWFRLGCFRAKKKDIFNFEINYKSLFSSLTEILESFTTEKMGCVICKQFNKS